jgi:hypothetical protein
VGDQVTEIRFLAQGATVNRYDVWTFWEDSNDDGQRDDFDGDGDPDQFIWCQFDGLGSAQSVPWTYALEVKVLRAGALQPETVTSEEALTMNGANRTAYDTLVSPNDEVNPQIVEPVIVTHTRGECSLNTAIRCNPSPGSTLCAAANAGVCRELRACSGDPATACLPPPASDICAPQGKGTCTQTVTAQRIFEFNNGALSTDPEGKRLMTGANPLIIGAVLNPLFDADPTRASVIDPATGNPLVDKGGGRCPNPAVGPELIDQAPPPLELVLHSGDTLIVHAERFDNQPDGFVFGTTPSLAAQVTVHGVPLTSVDVDGNLAGGASTGYIVDFSFSTK